MYTMLIADDEKWTRDRIISYFKWKKINVSIVGEAADGEEALALSKQLKPDIIISDIRMPGLNGLDFLKSLNEEGVNAKVIIISGYGDFEYAQKAIKLGVADYILKPVENAVLINAVKKCIRQIEAEAYKNKIIEDAGVKANLTGKLAGYINKSGYKNTIDIAITFINNNYHRPITLNDVSAEVKLNPSYFSKLFKNSIGISYSKYLTRFRINKAKELLADPTRRIKEISAMVGYKNTRYFTNVFKSLTKVSPNTFKEQL